MTKFKAKKVKVINSSPEVNEKSKVEVVQEEVKEEYVKEEYLKEEVKQPEVSEEKFKAGLLRVIESKVTAGQGRFLGLEEILPIFRSSI